MYRRPRRPDGFEDERYPKNWNRIRWYVFKRDNYTCQMCGRTHLTHPHCHHIIPVGRGGSHNTNNLITLCESCHKQIHGM
jgi:5-methylcytosine-specific restriction endonuclease McrA